VHKEQLGLKARKVHKEEWGLRERKELKGHLEHQL
jgi:hypothetical protein